LQPRPEQVPIRSGNLFGLLELSLGLRLGRNLRSDGWTGTERGSGHGGGLRRRSGPFLECPPVDRLQPHPLAQGEFGGVRIFVRDLSVHHAFAGVLHDERRLTMAAGHKVGIVRKVLDKQIGTTTDCAGQPLDIVVLDGRLRDGGHLI
jgi:hypothetical protein